VREADLGDGSDVRAWLSCRFPRRERRWVIRPPEDTSMEAVPV
jgi:hypothetical protein